MIEVKNIIRSEQTSMIRRPEVFLCKILLIATAVHVTGNVQAVTCREERENIPADIRLVRQIDRISRRFVNLRFRKVRIAFLVHIADIAQIEKGQIDRLRPRFK